MDTTEAHERLATVETKIEHIEEALRDIKASLDELKPIVWKAAGAAALLIFLFQVLLKGH